MKFAATLALLACITVLGWMLYIKWPVSQAVHLPDKLIVATEGGYPPFNFIDDSGKLSGFDVEITLALCEAMNTTCTVVRRDWKDLLTDLEKGEYDMVVASMASTSERRQKADFTNCYYRSRSAFVGRKGSIKDTSPQALKGKTLVTQAGTVQAQYLQKHFQGNSKIVFTKKVNEMYELLLNGTVDLALIDSLNILNFLTSEQGGDFDFIGEALPPENVSSCATIAVQKGSPLRERLNNAIEEIRLSGDYDAINREYFPFSIY